MNASLSKTVVSLLMAVVIFSANAQQKTDPNNQDEELGKVSWLRDYDVALQLSKKEKKPVFILFQEVPGCATCRNYGHNVMSNPLLVEAIENEFIPLAIFNNKGGKDKEVLKLYKEPTWNNPVVRIVNQTGGNLTQRIAGDYSALAVYNAITEVLTKQGRDIPAYITLLGEELKSKKYGASKDAYYSMYCFWSGEKQLGSNTGVLNTEAGFMKGKEVVKVTYNPEIVSDLTLTSFANQNKMSPISKDGSYRASSKDEDYYLQHTNYKYLPLSPLQRTKINSALGNRKSAKHYLSPKQQQWLSSMEDKEIRFHKDFAVAWSSMN